MYLRKILSKTRDNGSDLNSFVHQLQIRSKRLDSLIIKLQSDQYHDTEEYLNGKECESCADNRTGDVEKPKGFLEDWELELNGQIGVRKEIYDSLVQQNQLIDKLYQVLFDNPDSIVEVTKSRS